MKRRLFLAIIQFVFFTNYIFAQCNLYHPAKWSSKNVDYQVVPGFLDTWTAISAAANVWNGGGFGFNISASGSYTLDQKDLGDITPGVTSTLAETDVNFSGGIITSVTTWFNSIANWDLSASSDPVASDAYDLESDALHEMGHAIGFCLNEGTIDHHSTDPSSIMYAYLFSGTKSRTLTSDVVACLNAVYSGSTGIEDYIYFSGGPTTITQNSMVTYFTQFVDESPYGDHITSWEPLSFLVKHGEGEYVMTTDDPEIVWFGTLPFGYYWLRDANGNVLARVKAEGTDNHGYIHRAYYNITISGVPQNTTSGTLTHNETWGGLNNITGNVIVPSNITLKILPATTVNFPSNVSLTINGTLNAQGSTFTSTGGTLPGSWGSIVLSGSGANGSILNSVNMQYGTEIDVTSTTNITIQNSTIQNCINGIVGSTATGSILNNTIKNVTNHGINLSNCTFTCNKNVITKTSDFANYHSGFGILYQGGSSGTIWQNDIRGLGQGIGTIWGSSPQFWNLNYNGDYRNNRITNCLIGVMVYQSSYPTVDDPYPPYGVSTICNNTVDIALNTWYSTVSNLDAAEVYWNNGNPANAVLQVGQGSVIYTDPYATTDLWAGIPLPSIQTNDGAKGQIMASVASTETSAQTTHQSTVVADPTPTDPLFDGIYLRNSGKFNDAKNFFLSYLSKHPENQAAYVELYNCYSEETASDIISYFSSLPSQAAKGHKLLLSNLYLKQGNIEMAKKVNNNIIHDNPKTPLAARGKLNNAYIAIYNENDLKGAAKLFTDVLKRPDLSTDIDLSLTQEMIETYAATHGKEKPRFCDQAGTDQLLPATIDINSFPNPFNPTTVIRFQVLATSSIRLIVYDMLGREVATLANGIQEAGYHTATFDGSRLSSGIYFVRFTAQPSDGSTLFSKTMKILMTK